MSNQEKILVWFKNHDYGATSEIMKDLKMTRDIANHYLLTLYQGKKINRVVCPCGKGFIYAKKNFKFK